MFGDLRAALVAYQAAAHRADLAMEQAEAHGNVQRMESIAAKEQKARDAFYVESGLLQNAYYHTIDRVFTSFPEIAYAGGNATTISAGERRALTAIQAATEALADV
jgi:hypothetical protein